MKQILQTLFILSIVLILDCRLKKPVYHLTQSEAETRFEIIENIKYELDVHLTPKDSFEGKVKIYFFWKNSETFDWTITKEKSKVSF